jgi:hypothetical protein
LPRHAFRAATVAVLLLAPLSSRGQDATAPKPEHPAFDLTYVPPQATGIVAVRPNVIFSDPAMRPLARLANEGLAQLLQLFQLPTEPKLPVEEIEQIVGFIWITTTKTPPLGKHTLMAAPVLIRTAHDFDWPKLMRQFDPKAEEVRCGGRVYYRSHLKMLPFMPSEATLCYFIPDRRTLVLPQEKELRALLTGNPEARPRFSWDRDWKHVEHGLFAVTLDNGWARGQSAEEIGGEPWATVLTQNTATMVAGVSWSDGVVFESFLGCKDAASAGETVRVLEKVLAGQLPSSPSQDPLGQIASKFYKDLRDHAKVTRAGNTVCVRTSARISVADMAKLLLARAPKNFR